MCRKVVSKTNKGTHLTGQESEILGKMVACAETMVSEKQHFRGKIEAVLSKFRFNVQFLDTFRLKQHDIRIFRKNGYMCKVSKRVFYTVFPDDLEEHICVGGELDYVPCDMYFFDEF
jgi:hypothetical protein